MKELRLQMRFWEMTDEDGTHAFWQYRWARENGWAGPWATTPILALDAMRRVAKAVG